MGDLDIRIRHGGGSSRTAAAVVTVIGGLGVAAGASGVLAAAETALVWVAAVVTTAIATATVLVVRLMRRGWRPNYVRSVHGATQRDLQLDQEARDRAELRRIRAMRLYIEDQLIVTGSITGRLPAMPVPAITDRGLIQYLPPIPGHE